MSNVVTLFPSTVFDPNSPVPEGEKQIHAVVRTTKGAPGVHQMTIDVRWTKLDITAAWAALVSYLEARHKNGANRDVIVAVMTTCKRLPHTQSKGVFTFDFNGIKTFEVRMMEL